MENGETFEAYLKKSNLSQNTLTSYVQLNTTQNIMILSAKKICLHTKAI